MASSDIDQLFQLPLDEFTGARNVLAAQLKKAGQADDADSVRTLGKPSVSAWVANQLYWRHRQQFDRLLVSGERFRAAQAAQLSGKSADLQAPLEARREALSELSKLAAGVLRQSGHTPGPDMMRRITMTLEALSSYGEHPDAPAPGRLTRDVDPPGFEAIAALVPRARGGAKAAGGSSRVLPFKAQQHAARKTARKMDAREEARQRQEQRAAAMKAVRTAERELKAAKKAGELAEAALKKAAARAKAAERLKEEADKRLEKLAAEADETRQAARRVAVQAEEAAQAVADAERALEGARQRLEQ